jgi:ribonuclease III
VEWDEQRGLGREVHPSFAQRLHAGVRWIASMDRKILLKAERRLKHKFKDKKLLALALTHASVATDRLASNERLEFLGDSVLGLVVCDFLFATYRDLLEGDLTKIKSSVVSRATCALVAQEIGLADLLVLGKGMDNHTKLPLSLAAAVFESLIGALFIDAGLEPARRFIMDHMGPKIRQAVKQGHQFNFKSVLQQASQQRGWDVPQYVVLDEKGPDHAKCFEVCVEIGVKRYSACWGPSKKQAEQQAALAALNDIGMVTIDADGEVQMLEESQRVA